MSDKPATSSDMGCLVMVLIVGVVAMCYCLGPICNEIHGLREDVQKVTEQLKAKESK